MGQMDTEQDVCERQVLVLSPTYFESEYCRHELERAVARDPEFHDGVVIPVIQKNPTRLVAITGHSGFNLHPFPPEAGSGPCRRARGRL